MRDDDGISENSGRTNTYLSSPLRLGGLAFSTICRSSDATVKVAIIDASVTVKKKVHARRI